MVNLATTLKTPRQFLPFLALTMWVGGTAIGQEATVPESERQALIAFFQAMDGENWLNNQGWLGPPGSEDGWAGVTVENGHVTRLRLAVFGVDGGLPPELADLTELRELDLCSNPCVCAFRPSVAAAGRVQTRPGIQPGRARPKAAN